LEKERARPRPRIETLGDLIFGLSLSVGSIALIANSPSSPSDINSHILAFVFTFLMLITAWIIYTSQMSVLPVETRTVTFLNVLLLLLVAITPYLLNNVELGNPSLSPADLSTVRDYASTLFAVDLGSILLILAFFAHILSIEEKKLVAPEVARLIRGGRNTMLVLAAVMFASTAPQLWSWTLFGLPLRMFIWYLPLIAYWGGRAVQSERRA
jgi:hypothetical protein